jgi:YcaO-like protein with predicted kinase domain
MRLFGRQQVQAKTYLSGTHRARSPAETLADYAPFMSRMGITRLANVTGLDNIGIPVYMCVRPNSRNLSVAQGKGLDVVSAKVSALMESIENWHAESTDRPLKYESQTMLRRTAPTLDLNELTRWATAPAPTNAPILWVEGYDLLREEPVWVPHEMVILNYVSSPGYVPMLARNSNGLASGNHTLEAISHALCEVIERDAMALWHLDETDPSAKTTQLDLATVDDPACRTMLAQIQRADLRVAAWDISSDMGIPCYACIVFDRPGMRVVGPCAGYGCHLSPAIALGRAISEAVQSRLTMIAGSRDDLIRSRYQDARSEDELRELDEGIASPPPVRNFHDRTSLATATFEEDIAVLLNALRRVGISSTAVVDLTKSDIGIPVVKLIVPGLEDGGAVGYRPGPRAIAQMERSE